MTISQLESLRLRRKNGEATAALAAEVGLTPDTLRAHWRRNLRQPLSSHHEWSLEEARATWSYFQAGESTEEIAESIGITVTALRAAWKRYLGQTIGLQKTWTLLEAEETWARHEAGESTRALAKTLGVTQGALLTAWGRLLGKMVKGSGKNLIWTKPQIKASWERRMAEESTASIAADMGVSPSVLRAAWKRHGYTGLPNSRLLLTPEMVCALWVRRQGGETGADLAAEVGVAASTLYTAWAKRGWSAREEYDYGAIDCRNLWGWRNQKQSWSWICEKLGMEVHQKNRDLLQARLRRYCDRNEIPMPTQ